MATLQFKRGSAATLNAYTTPPLAGEPVWEKDSYKLKVGDGTTLYKDLPYVGEFTVDEASVTRGSNDIVALFGFDAANAGSSPVKSADGKIEWKLLATKADVEEIEATISEDIVPQLEAFGARLDEVEGNIDEIKTDLIHVHQQLEEHDDRLDALEDWAQQLNPERIEEALETIEQVEDRLDDMQADVGQLKGDVEEIKAKDEEQDATLADHEERIEALEEGGISPQDIAIIDGGTADTVIIEAHDPQN